MPLSFVAVMFGLPLLIVTAAVVLARRHGR